MHPAVDRGVPPEERQALACCGRADRDGDVSRRTADVASDPARPPLLDTRMVKPGRQHLIMAGPKYLDVFDAPKSAGELVKHRLAMHEVGAGIGIVRSYADASSRKMIPFDIDSVAPSVSGCPFIPVVAVYRGSET